MIIALYHAELSYIYTFQCLLIMATLISRVHNIYTEESILLSYAPVEGHIVKL